MKRCVCILSSHPLSGGEPLPGQSRGRNTSVYPDGVGTGQPAWVAFDRQVKHTRQIIIINKGEHEQPSNKR